MGNLRGSRGAPEIVALTREGLGQLSATLVASASRHDGPEHISPLGRAKCATCVMRLDPKCLVLGRLDDRVPSQPRREPCRTGRQRFLRVLQRHASRFPTARLSDRGKIDIERRQILSHRLGSSAH